MGIFFKKIIITLKVFLLICGLATGIGFCLMMNAKASNVMSIKYLDVFPGTVSFDSKYKNTDEYLIYKYVDFSFEEVISVNSIGLNFIVDNDWYNKNKVNDVLFLKFDNGNWARVKYIDKTTLDKHRKYQVVSDSVGQYWAIVGVLSKQKTLPARIIEKKNIEYKKTFSLAGYSNFIKTITEVGSGIMTSLKSPANVKGASVVATTTATASIVTLLVFLNGPASLWIILQQMMVAFFGIFFSKKRHRSGIVYDANTGVPVSLVRVDLIDSKSARIKSTRFTDKEGKYYFLVPKGEYYLELRKKGYKIVESGKGYLLKALLHESDIELEMELDEAGIIKKNIAILKEDSSSHGKMKVFFMVIMKYLANVLFFGGVIISLWNCYINPVLFNYFILGIYVLIIMFKSFFAKTSKYGIIVNINDRPEPFATISILDAETKKVISRVISDTNGRYYVLLEKGEYILNVKTVKGASVERKVIVKNKNILSQKLIIQK